MAGEAAKSEWFPICMKCGYVDRSIVYATFPWLLSEECPNCGGTVWDPVPRDYQGDYQHDDTKTDAFGLPLEGELGDKLAAALQLQPASGDTVHTNARSHTVRIGGRSRPWWRQLWLRLLPGNRCRLCGSRLSRTDPYGQPSRVWWCPEHGPWEQPERPGWAMEERTTRVASRRRLP